MGLQPGCDLEHTPTATVVETKPIRKMEPSYPQGLDSAFELYHPELGRYRKIPSFIDTLKLKYGNDPGLLQDGADIFHQFNEEYGDLVDQIGSRLKYLGLNKNLVVEGENSSLITKIVKSMNFGRQTSEDR